MALYGGDGGLCFGRNSRIVLVFREEFRVAGVEPCPGISIDDPISPSSRKPKLRFETPAIVSIVDQLGGVVLACRCYHTQTGTKDCLLAPLTKILGGHRGTTDQVNRETINRVEETGTIHVGFIANHIP